jgi:hypothetical protein
MTYTYGPCSVDRCDNAATYKSTQLCGRHYQRLRLYGRPDEPFHWDRRDREHHPLWRDGAVDYKLAHLRISRLRGPARRQTCACGAPAAHWAYDHSDPDALTSDAGQKYSMDPYRYVAMCVACHGAFDAEHRHAA